MIDLIIPLILAMTIGIFTASETGLVSIDKIRLLKAKHEKKTWAVRLDRFNAHPERFFSTINFCENFIIVAASTLFTRFFVDRIGNSGVILSTVALSLFALFFGQFVPKSIALIYPVETMAALSSIIHYIGIATYPVVWFYAVAAKYIARLFPGRNKVSPVHRLDIVYAMSEYEKRGSRLASRLFNFSRRRVGEVMIPLDAAFMCARGRELETIAAGRPRIYTRIPVYDGVRSNVIGVFNIKDFLYTGETTLRAPFFVRAEERCMAIFLMMKQRGEHMAIVTENGCNTGIVTLEDLIEELVGEIRDER